MKQRNEYLLALGVAFIGITVTLGAFGADRLELYLGIFVVEYVALTFMFAYLRNWPGRILNGISFVLITAFALALVARAATVIVSLNLS